MCRALEDVGGAFSIYTADRDVTLASLGIERLATVQVEQQDNFRTVLKAPYKKPTKKAVREIYSILAAMNIHHVFIYPPEWNVFMQTHAPPGFVFDFDDMIENMWCVSWREFPKRETHVY